LSVKI